MKNLLKLFFLLSSFAGFSQQWQGSTTNTGLIHRDGSLILGGTTVQGNYGSNWKFIEIQDEGIITIGQSVSNRLQLVHHSAASSLRSSNSMILSGDNGLKFQTNGDWQNNKMIILQNGNVGIGSEAPDKKLEVNGDILLKNSSGIKQIYTWAAADDNWRIGMNSNPGFSRSLATNHVQFLTYASGQGQGFAVGVNGGQSSFEINGADHSAFFRGDLGIGTSSPAGRLSMLRGPTNSGSKTWNSINQATIDFYADSQDGYNRYLDISAIGQVSGGQGGSKIRFITNPVTSDMGVERMLIDSNGNVGIGTDDPQSKLAVNGQIRATEVKVLADISVPDYVFEPDYELRTLKETKEYINEYKHLPEIPSAKEIGENGIDLGDMNMRLLKKIEELTLYQIELLEKLEEQNDKLLEQQKRIEKLESKG